MIVVGGSGSGKLAAVLAKHMNIKLANVEVKKFPDSETYVRVQDELKGQKVILCSL